MKTELPDRQKSLVQWVSQATGISTFGVKIRLQGNELHILCEGRECPQRWQTLSDLLRALQQTDLDVLTSIEQPAIYQVFVYGRKKGENQPRWCHKVYLNQLDRHLEQVEQALLEDEGKSQKAASGGLIVSNETLAHQGDPEAIARYLSETLSTFDIAVQVEVIKQKSTQNNYKNQTQLWVFCESSYSNPDPSLIAEPVAQKLRHLKLSGYQEAVIASRVKGEKRIDWLFKVDLTPSKVMLKEWARWGDVQALSRLLSETLLESKVTVEAILKESTLHIFCTPVSETLATDPILEKTLCLQAVRPVLEKIAPQGIVAATVYGQKITDNQPAWVDWLSLPANEHPALAISAQQLATSGDERAIVFLLERLLNPDLDMRLKTGGIRVFVQRIGDLLHIMCDAPLCPAREQVASQVTEFVHQLKISGIAGVRVYGRCAGNKEPFWDYSVDYKHREPLVAQATPKFAPTSAYVHELPTSETDEPVLRPNISTEEIYIFVTQVTQDWSANVRKLFLATQLFTENKSQQKTKNHHQGQGLKVALVWGALGLLLTLQTDWILGKFLSRITPPTSTVSSVSPKSSSTIKTSYTDSADQKQRTAFFTSTSKEKSPKDENNVFNASNSTQPDLEASPLKSKATPTAIILAARSHKSGSLLRQIPSFNASQLDEQLILYKQRLAKTGHPPDVLIIGSSRALRGIDPVAISKSLATQGSQNIDVFNFGINGATAKVVDFVVRRVLKPSELPKLIIWADGARAFNSGREDITFSTIAASPGYQYVLQKAASTEQETAMEEPPQGESTYQAVDIWLSKGLATFSATYQKRDNLKNLLKQQLKYLPIISNTNQAVTQKSHSKNPEDIQVQAVEFDGFLPLSTRFQPTTYYQKYSLVSGNYDNDYKYFRLQGEQNTALQTLLRFTQSQKITLVFVNMPVTAYYLDSVRSKYEQEFQQYMQSLAGKPNFIYQDLSQLWPKANDYFSDPSHLNRYGAYKISKKLANDPTIPWFSK
ncbi:DUF1574 family protein [Brasilonema octagenarum]|uniref:DUF1574 domain-containing protein n=1 Tax=Brasilonema octagenarum UFV-OR1 TaxID=417115 RepID=A0ABX1MBW0_9CYAN|nr:DUF1574 family protein [Brasilonema octagenarum]NMF66107.1 DUF1574 domain-containing protein [Brasilonema octagenarum UFV-OR1]